MTNASRIPLQRTQSFNDPINLSTQENQEKKPNLFSSLAFDDLKSKPTTPSENKSKTSFALENNLRIIKENKTCILTVLLTCATAFVFFSMPFLQVLALSFTVFCIKDICKMLLATRTQLPLQNK